jgi:hypothetical protein
VSIWHWVAGIGVIILLTATKGAVRGGIMILLITFFVARLAYVLLTRETLP